jgi:TonB family protein
VGRYLAWSLAFHLAVLGSGAVLAPLGGLFGSSYKPTQIISVGLVDFAEPPKSEPVAVPQPPVPTPAGDAAIALAPESDLTLENLPEEQPEPEEPEPTEEEAADSEAEGEAGSDDAEDSTLLAQAEGESDVSHALTEGPGDGDIWGVETPANVNPYHRRGFALIRQNWRNPVVGPIGRKCVVRFRVERSGDITDIELERSSGSQVFDEAALRAVRYAKTWDAFPAFWEEDEQIIHLEFEYRP